MMRRRNSNPILTWAGPTSGSQDLVANPNLNFTTPGTYTFTVTRSIRHNRTAAGAGASGQVGSVGGNGGNGGASGAKGTASNVLVEAGITYEIRVPAANAGVSAYLAVQGGAKLIEMGSGSGRTTPGTVVTGAGVAGSNGGLGGGAGGVAPDGANGAINVGGAGSGGGGGAEGSVALGAGGSGGGLSNGNPGGGAPPGIGSFGGPGASVTVAGISCARGGGGGGSGSTGSGGDTPGTQGAVQLDLVF